uniref:cytochrome b n=1 Tax=Taeniothrips eucharii TaxID=1818613 RepID=UPI0030DE85AB
MKNYNKIYNNIIFKPIYKNLINLPTPMNLWLTWNFGSILGMCLLIQILSGLFLAMHYTPHINMAFQSVMHICRDVNMGWLLRTLHSNGASFFFMCMYSHMARGLYYKSYTMTGTWIIGMTIFLMTMASAFLGYVLPWGQMSFWGATVITNLLSAIPYVGNSMVLWIWGGFSVDNSTLNRFFVFHFILPFVVLSMVILHLMFLHLKGSSNPLGLSSSQSKIPFNPYFSMKDLMGFMMLFLIMAFVIFFYPYYLGDPDNFMMANPMSTPPHIKPEWYFLFAYAILRATPTKLGGVTSLLMSIMVLMILPLKMKKEKKKESGAQFKPLTQMVFWIYVSSVFSLTWLGAMPVEEPFSNWSYYASLIYFKSLLIFSKMN